MPEELDANIWRENIARKLCSRTNLWVMTTLSNQDKTKFSTKDTKKEWPARRENSKIRMIECF